MNPDNNQSGQQPGQGRFMDSIQGPNQNSQQSYSYAPNVSNPIQQPAAGQGFSPQQQTYPNGGPVVQNPQQNGSVKPKQSSKRKFIIVAVVGVAVLAILTTAALLATPKKKQPSNQSTNNNAQSSDSAQKPADAIDVGNTNNSINQDISGLNTDNDFPATQLDDKSLNL